MTEEWRPVVGYEGLYEVSNTGNIRSLFRYKKILKWNVLTSGYATVQLFKNKVGTRILVHRIVAQAFIPNPNNFPQINHKDENKLNNSVSNLEWCTAKYNMTYGTAPQRRIKSTDYSKEIYKQIARENGKKVSRPVKQIKDGVVIAEFCNAKEASRKTGINHSHILECAAKKQYCHTAGGYQWEYAERRIS